jgi:hypothetical protein
MCKDKKAIKHAKRVLGQHPYIFILKDGIQGVIQLSTMDI